jgi:hypothetical protein
MSAGQGVGFRWSDWGLPSLSFKIVSQFSPTNTTSAKLVMLPVDDNGRPATGVAG